MRIYRIGIILLSCLCCSCGSALHATRTILVTAATSALGKAICDKLAQQGDHLILAGRTLDKLEALKGDLEKKYKSTHEILLFDYKNLQSIQESAAKQEAPINGVVLIPPRPTLPVEGMPSPKEWQQAVSDCFIAPLEFVRALAPQFTPESSIVVISGITSVYYIPKYANTNVLRVMWAAEIKNLVTQLSPRKIRVNEISPGVILTQHNIQKIQERAKDEGRSYDEQLSFETHDTPLNQYGQPEDVAHSVAFLLGNGSKHVNGINLILDGGLSRAY